MAEIDSDFSVNHAAAATFEADGPAPYFEYRDLGVKDATKGAIAHVIRAAEAFDGRGTGPRRHERDFQLAYVPNGWARIHTDGVGEVTMGNGGCFNQPPGIAHGVVEYSDDFEVLEIVSPADFGTEDLEAEATEAAPA